MHLNSPVRILSHPAQSPKVWGIKIHTHLPWFDIVEPFRCTKWTIEKNAEFYAFGQAFLI
jgi:hypothetical protein